MSWPLKVINHKPRLSRRDTTPASRLARSAPGALPQTPGTHERASVCDAGVTFSKGASELRLVVVLPPPPQSNLSF